MQATSDNLCEFMAKPKLSPKLNLNPYPETNRYRDRELIKQLYACAIRLHGTKFMPKNTFYT